jgi:hypothetical protein
MPIDLFEQSSISTKSAPRDLFAENDLAIPEAREPSDPYEKRAKELSPFTAALLGAEKGIRGFTQGTKQLGLMGLEKLGLVDAGTAERFAKKEMENMAYYPALKNAHPIATTGGEIAGGIAATLPLGGASIPAKLIANPVTRGIATGAAQGAIVGGLEFDPETDIMNRIKSAAIGGTVGAAVPAVIAGGGRIIKGKNTPAAIEATQDLGKLSNEMGVDLSVPELRGSVGGKYVESLLEKVPGTGYIGFREKQAGQFKNTAEKLAAEIGGDTTENYGAIVQEGLKDTLKKNKSQAKTNFDKVERIANAQGGKIDFVNTQNEAKTILGELTQLPEQFQNPQLINYAENFANLENLPFNVARELRSKLGDEVSKLKKASNLGTAEAGEYRMATRLFDALENDMTGFADKAGGALKSAYTEARKQYLDKVVPFKKGELAKVLKDDYDTDQLIGAFLKPGRENLASKLVQNSTNKGLTAARASILNTALEKASQGEFFNPQVFAKEALRLGKANRIVFTTEQRTSLDGYAKLAKAAERVSKFAANPETGARLSGPVAIASGAAATAFSPKFALAILGGLGAAKLMRSEIGRKLLTRASHLPDKGADKAWQTLLKDVSKLIAPVAATSPSMEQQAEL